mgnify:CR=1 FL=1
MVELDPEDYNSLLRWFEKAWGHKRPEEIPLSDRRTFWKLTFLCEDRIRELKDEQDEN